MTLSRPSLHFEHVQKFQRDCVLSLENSQSRENNRVVWEGWSQRSRFQSNATILCDDPSFHIVSDLLYCTTKIVWCDACLTLHDWFLVIVWFRHIPEIRTLAMHHLTLYDWFLTIVFSLDKTQSFINFWTCSKRHDGLLYIRCYNRERRNHTTRCRYDVGVVWSHRRSS